MAMLSIVGFILWSTGLCTLALLGLTISDTLTERARANKISSEAVPASKPEPGSHEQPAPTLHAQLLKAA